MPRDSAGHTPDTRQALLQSMRQLESSTKQLRHAIPRALTGTTTAAVLKNTAVQAEAPAKRRKGDRPLRKGHTKAEACPSSLTTTT